MTPPTTALAPIFLEGLPAEARQRFAAIGDLEARLAALCHTAEAACPDAALPIEAFLRYAAERVADTNAPERSLEELHAGDLYVACACGRGMPSALALFEARFFPAVEPPLRRLRLAEHDMGEMKQRLRQLLLVGDADVPAKLLEYRGRGGLEQWLRVVAVRRGLNYLRGGRRLRPLEEELERSLETPEAGPELAYAKDASRKHVQAAYRDALAGLSARDKNLISHHYVAGLGIDRIGEIYNVHRATAARWLEQARQRLFTLVQRNLMRDLRLSESDCESLVRFAWSQIDLTLQRHLETEPEQ